MKDKKKAPSGSNRKGAIKYLLLKTTKPLPLPQERMLRQAHWKAVQQVNIHPTPANHLFAMLVAAAWKKAFTDGGTR